MSYKNLKNRFTALALAVVMIIGMLGAVNVSGAEVDSGNSRAVKFLTALDIMKTDENTGMLWDETPVRRGEMAEILCKMFDVEVKESIGSTFTDVKGEEKAYIETAVANGYMNGNGDGTFAPDEFILNEQLIKIFVSVLGGGHIAEYMGGYPTGYANVAKKIGLTKNLNGGLSDVARRVDVASMIYDAMHADMFEIEYIGSDGARYDRTKGETFLTEALNIYSYEGILNKNEATALNRPNGVGEGKIQVGATVLNDSKRLADNYLGCYVEVYAKKSDKTGESDVVYVEETDNRIYTIKDENVISASDSGIEYYDGEKEKKLVFSEIPDMVYNGKAVDFDAAKLEVKCGFIKLTDNNNDGKIDFANVCEYTTYIVNEVQAEKNIITFKYGENSLELDDNYYRIYKDGKESTLNDLGEDDVILAAISDGVGKKEKSITLQASSDYVMGSVEKIRTESEKTYVTVGGIEYPVSAYCKKLTERGTIPEITAGISGKFSVDALGNIAVYSANESGMSVGYMIKGITDKGAFTSELSVKIFNEANKIQVLKSGDKIKIDSVKYDVSDVAKNSDIMTKFTTPQLVKYKVKDDKLTEINFANDGYDATKFSKDVERSLRCTNNSILADTYYVTSGTKVFLVPDFVTDETSYYGISNGSYIVRDRNYNGAYYDIENDGKISYAVIKSDSTESGLLEGSPLLVVSAIVNTLDKDGDDVVAVDGYDESGNKVTVIASDESVTNGIKAGDVIRYRTDFDGCMPELKKIASYDDTTYNLYTIANSTKYVLGEVGYKGGDQLSVSGKAVNANLTPLDMIKIVYNNGNAMFRYSAERKALTKIDFSEIEYGDRIFACVTGGNTTKMLVIYD